MQMWRFNLLGGKRASDRGVPAPASYGRDRALEKAIRTDRIELRFQPQIEPGSGRIAGVEALARWADVAGPEQLFLRADRAHLSERLSRSIQRKALRTAGQWTGAMAALNLSINLLPMDLERPGFERWLLDEIAAAGLAPERITVEIVESSAQLELLGQWGCDLYQGFLGAGALTETELASFIASNQRAAA